jgi:hypothetical protein
MKHVYLCEMRCYRELASYCNPLRPHSNTRVAAFLDALATTHARWWGRPEFDREVPTLTHGDTHPGNLYVGRDGTPGFLDAQPRRSPWYHDVSYHMICALDIPDRRRWENLLLTRYLERLASLGVPDWAKTS